MSGVWRTLAALVAGVVFGIGLIVAGMTDPAKVQNFLDLAGIWDPSLAFVMGAAVVVAFVGYRLSFTAGAPLFAPKFLRIVFSCVWHGFGWRRCSGMD